MRNAPTLGVAFLEMRIILRVLTKVGKSRAKSLGFQKCLFLAKTVHNRTFQNKVLEFPGKGCLRCGMHRKSGKKAQNEALPLHRKTLHPQTK